MNSVVYALASIYTTR